MRWNLTKTISSFTALKEFLLAKQPNINCNIMFPDSIDNVCLVLLVAEETECHNCYESVLNA